MLCALLPCTVFAADVESGTCGDNLMWTLNISGTLTISGTVGMTTWGWYEDVPWYRNRSSVRSVVIESGVTSIGENTFSNCSSLTSIEIPDSVTSIGESAFKYCQSLTGITIPDSVTSIRDCVFDECDSLTDVYYGGSEEDWSNISIAYGNTPLENATIHYNSSMPGAEIVKSGELDEGISWTLDSEGEFGMTAEDGLSEYTIILIGYNEDGEMKQSAVINGESAKINTEGVKFVKIFIWESIESMKPLCEAYTIEIEK